VDDRENIRSTAGEDAAMESALLQYVLALHPAAITLEELARELGEARDDVDRAVRDLVGTGLLNWSDSLVLPSRAALRFDELMER
jgi:DNA-binding IclR family transcriptional regulator